MGAGQVGDAEQEGRQVQPGAAERAGRGRVLDAYSTVTLPASSLTPGWGPIDVSWLP